MNDDSRNRLLTIRGRLMVTQDTMSDQRQRFAALAGRHEAGTAPKAVSAFNLFQTPDHVAEQMARKIAQHVTAGRILEPSAGLGRIYKALHHNCVECTIILVEESAECCKALYPMTEFREGDRLFQQDFLTLMPGDIGGTVHAVCMNPPFKQGEDIKHIQHALAMLDAGGLLVSLCYNGARQNAYLKPRCNTWEVLPDNTFRAEGTSASVVMLTIIKEDA